jgi:hypothetical protein
MKLKVLRVGLTLLTASAIAACEARNPNLPGTSFGAPQPAGPGNGTTFKFSGQPVTLTINNVPRTSPATVTYSVEVSSDSTFVNKVFTRDGIAEGAGATTNVTLGSLGGGATYYWRWYGVVDGVIGQPSAAQAFVVQPQIVIGAPVISDPASGATVGTKPTFVTRNATRTGPAGAIVYEFEVSTTSAFTSTVASAAVPEQAGATTSWTPANDLPAGTLFWRVRATDPSNSEASPFTNGTSFAVQPFSLRDAVIHNNPQDLASWPETASITRIDFGSHLVVDFDKRTGPGRWPDVPFGIPGDSLQYTLGMCLNVSSRWHCSAVIHFWFGRALEDGGPPSNIALDWFYDQARWGAMAGHQPAQGEQVGIFAAAGNLRDNGLSIVKERTNVVLLPFGTNYRK